MIWLTVLLVAVVTGCGGAHRYDSRLAAVDSLMQPDPDSALALVQAIPAASLTTEGDRAYRDLLLTQARYRCYITATSDSDINRALDYYRHHDRDREKLTRAYIYKGAVMEELGHPDSAMFYYKTAEATAVPTDYFNLGYTNMRIGDLYQSHFAASNLVVQRMRRAMNYFIACRDTNYIILSMGTLGSFMNQIDKDSAVIMLNKAILLARSIHSPDQFFYKSKLAGIFFYQKDYPQAKKLAMEIIKDGKNKCNESTFYYYAARSFIKMGQVDSAIWVKSIIPSPVTRVDSFNYFLLQADLSKESHNMLDYGLYSAKAEKLHRLLLEHPSESKLITTELECNASLQQNQLTTSYKKRILWIALLVFISLMMILLAARILMNRKNRRFQQELNRAQLEIKNILVNSEQQVSDLMEERKKHQREIKKINKELSQVTRKYQKLEQEQQDIHERASTIVRERNAALNDLYNDIRIKIESQNDRKKTIIPLNSLIRDFNENRNILHLTPKESFWKKLKLAVDHEYNGITSFVEKNYPSLSMREHHLFWLLCDIPPQIIKLCMNYSSAVTVSNNKRRLMKEGLGLDIKFEDFINRYLNSDLDNDQ